eukprot:1829897-Pyramimonas_sp.AAC.1
MFPKYVSSLTEVLAEVVALPLRGPRVLPGVRRRGLFRRVGSEEASHERPRLIRNALHHLLQQPAQRVLQLLSRSSASK